MTTKELDIARPPAYDGGSLSHVCSDPYGTGAHVIVFTDETALIVSAGGTHSRWAEEPWEVRSLSRGPRCPWAWLSGPVRAEAWRRVVELDELLGS